MLSKICQSYVVSELFFQTAITNARLHLGKIMKKTLFIILPYLTHCLLKPQHLFVSGEEMSIGLYQLKICETLYVL